MRATRTRPILLVRCESGEEDATRSLDQIAPTEYTNRDGALIPTRHPPPPREGFGDRFGIIYVDFEAWTPPRRVVPRDGASERRGVETRFPLIDVIDIAFDFRSDTPPGGDPDARSPTLRRYHELLWSKPLPSGAPFELDVTTPHVYLHHLSELGEFFLSSDAVIPTFSRELRLAHIMDQIPEVEREAFHHIAYTIGGMMVFPGNRVGGKTTINVARGFHPKIKDRFDLTLECIRRHYLDESSPLGDTLARYADFFALFGDFAGYVDFFHLQDLVDKVTSAVKFFMPFEDFTASPLPGTVNAYFVYRQRAIEFIESRNRRIAAHVGADR